MEAFVSEISRFDLLTTSSRISKILCMKVRYVSLAQDDSAPIVLMFADLSAVSEYVIMMERPRCQTLQPLYSDTAR
jgi:hypothetical protein